jgi:hypothetical protein
MSEESNLVDRARAASDELVERARKRHRLCIGIAVGVFGVTFMATMISLAATRGFGSSDSGGGGGGGTSGLPLPAIEPPVKQAAPHGMSLASFGVDETLEFRNRFFSDEGPTNVFQILSAVDGRTASIWMRIEQFSCLDDPDIDVPYNLTVWGGDAPVQMHAQCAEVLGAGFVLVWRSNTTVHLYDRGPETAVAAIVEVNATTGNATRVEVWYSVGLSNLNGSHAVVHIVADPVTRAFEMAAAGAGIGFCGAQLLSDGTVIRLTGSDDRGTTCAEASSVCVQANSLTNTTACTDAAFTLTPLGRLAYADANGTTQGASAYPGGSANSVLLRADGADDTLFGPSAIPEGLL